MKPARIRKNGFTLLEVIIAIVIIGVLATSINLVWVGTNLTLQTDANELANAVRYTQSLSMSSNQRYRLVVLSSTSYQITNASGTPVKRANGSTITTLSPGITIDRVNNLPNNLVAFNTLGVPYVDTGTPGTPLTGTGVIRLNQNGTRLAVRILPETGRVTVS